MAGPPKDVPASELFQKLTSESLPSEVVDFPRLDKHGKPVAQIRIRVLSQRDHDTARKMALERLKRQGLSKDDQTTGIGDALAGDASAKELLALACYTPDPAIPGDESSYGRVFADASQVEQLTSDEVAALFNHYINVQYKFGPFERTVTTEQELTDWITRLKEGASSAPLVQLSLPALADLAFRMATRAYKLSAALESQWSSLPPGLQSSLENCSLDTGLFGKLALNTATESDDDLVGDA
jgi:hypothetical protein